MIKDFKKISDMSPEVIEKYSSQVPEELVQIWKEYGVGTFLNDYLKIINPDDYKEFVEETYFRGKESIPVLATAFGDVITWQQNEFLGQVKYKESDFELFMEDMPLFLRFLYDDEFINAYFEMPLYQKAIKKYGELELDECFGFVPLLGLGGKKHIDNLDKVKIKEHLYLITELVGGVF